MATSNTLDCIEQFRGRKLIGVIERRLPIGRPDISRDTLTLVFDNGKGLTFFGDSGVLPAYRDEKEEDIIRAVNRLRDQYIENQKALDRERTLSGALAGLAALRRTYESID